MTYTAAAKLVETKLANRVIRVARLCMPLMLVFAAPPTSYAQLFNFSKQDLIDYTAQNPFDRLPTNVPRYRMK